MSHNILVVDDDSHIREVIRFALEKAGMQVWEAPNGEAALMLLPEVRPALLVLDIVMPEMDGLSLCREIRKTSELPILFLSSRDDEIDRVLGLELGGDDYVTKPFSPRELVARVQTILKRLPDAWPAAHPPDGASAPAFPVRTLSHGGVKLSVETRCAYWREVPVVLTATEFNLLHALLRYPGRVYSRDDLMAGGVFSDVVNDRTVDSHVRRLRAKYAELGGLQVVETVHGFGYKLGPCG